MASSWRTSTSAPQGVLTGSARQAQEAQEDVDGAARIEDLEQRQANLEARREAVEAQTAALWREFEDDAASVRRLLSHGSTGVEDRADQRAEQGRMRQADSDEPQPPESGVGARERRVVTVAETPERRPTCWTRSGTCACTSPGSRRSRCARSPT